MEIQPDPAKTVIEENRDYFEGPFVSNKNLNRHRVVGKSPLTKSGSNFILINFF